jgi:copper(I)-binding protein
VSPNRLVATVLLLLLGVTGCAAGMNDETSRERTTPFVANASVGSVQIRDALISPATGGSGGAQAYLTMVLLSDQPDTLTGASISGGGTVTPMGGPIQIKPNQLVRVTDPQASGGGAGSSSPAAAGSSAAAPSPSASASSPSGSGSASPSGSASARPLSSSSSTAPAAANASPGASALTPSGSSALAITGLPQPPQVGTSFQVTLTFQNAGSVQLQVPVDLYSATDR